MPSVLGCSPSGSRYGNVPNELIHRAGPPFLDNHYRGYQYESTKVQSLGTIVNTQTTIVVINMKALKCNPLALLLTRKPQILVVVQGSSSMLGVSAYTIICLGYRLLVSHQTPRKLTSWLESSPQGCVPMQS